MALALFAITLFVSAFILFLVQPIIGKTILPKLGGAPQVWNTCMVFFQSVLLLGYFYTHASSNRLQLRRQLVLHCILLFIPFLILLPNGPFDITNWIPTLGANPLISTLVILFAVVGIPFFVVSTSAPLLQKWFGSTGHPAAKDPYFLYGASNLGSMLALVLYPIVIEPYMDLTPQKWMWTVGYGVLVVLVLLCAALIWKPAGEMKFKFAGPPVEPPSEGQPVPPPVLETAPADTGITATPPAPAPVATAAKSTAIKRGKPQVRPHAVQAPAEKLSLRASADEMTTWRRLRWIGLAAVPSSLMLGVTTHITTDLSPIPLFWLIPLTIYLLSFILVFSKWPVTWVDAPHTVMLYVQPALIAVMVLVDIMGPHVGTIWTPIAFDVLAFGATALVCHGELAKDRPSTKHLTEFYLLMSVGGMLGGFFNGIFAPLAFVKLGVAEFGVAVACACFLRPKMKDSGWADDLVAGLTEQPAAPVQAQPHKGHKGQHPPRSIARAGASASTTRFLDFALPVAVVVLSLVAWMVASPNKRGDTEAATGLKYAIVFGIPLAIAAFYYGRPLRFGLTIAGIMVFHALISTRGEHSLYKDRSYFGVLNVNLGEDFTYTQLTHGRINHGMNFFHPDDKNFWGNPDKDFSRLATTYYHRLGPAGVVMEKFNWFPGKLNTYAADARMPVSLIGQAALPLGIANLPMGQLVDLWSEPAYATIGLGTGTMASYGRPYQHVHYYEIDNHVRRLSLPLGKNEYYFSYYNPGRPDGLLHMPGRNKEDDYYLTRYDPAAAQPWNFGLEIPFTYKDYRDSTPRTYFNMLKEAVHRGCEVEVLMGDARLRMDLPYKNFHAKDEKGVALAGGGPEDFYHMMVVDAFSSDAIPVHLITKEAIAMYFKHLKKDGILCVHTSNRYVDLPLVVAAVAKDLGYAYMRGHDQAPGGELGHFTSEWIMVAKRKDIRMVHGKEVTEELDPLASLFVPKDYEKLCRENPKMNPNDPYWSTPTPYSKYLWTDDHSNLWNVLR